MTELPPDYSYWGMMTQYGIRDVLRSRILWGAILSATLIVVVANTVTQSVDVVDVQTAIGIMIGIDGVLLAVVLAGLAIVVSLMDKNMLRFLWKEGFLGQLLFLFRSSGYSLGGGIILGGALYLALFLSPVQVAVGLGLSVLSWFFLLATVYGILSAINLVTATAYFGVFKAQFVEMMNERDRIGEEAEKPRKNGPSRTAQEP